MPPESGPLSPESGRVSPGPARAAPWPLRADRGRSLVAYLLLPRKPQAIKRLAKRMLQPFSVYGSQTLPTIRRGRPEIGSDVETSRRQSGWPALEYRLQPPWKKVTSIRHSASSRSPSTCGTVGSFCAGAGSREGAVTAPSCRAHWATSRSDSARLSPGRKMRVLQVMPWETVLADAMAYLPFASGG
jgi:hypothetical protein